MGSLLTYSTQSSVRKVVLQSHSVISKQVYFSPGNYGLMEPCISHVCVCLCVKIDFSASIFGTTKILKFYNLLVKRLCKLKHRPHSQKYFQWHVRVVSMGTTNLFFDFSAITLEIRVNFFRYINDMLQPSTLCIFCVYVPSFKNDCLVVKIKPESWKPLLISMRHIIWCLTTDFSGLVKVCLWLSSGPKISAWWKFFISIQSHL